MLGSNDPNTILDPTRIRCSRSRIASYVSARTPLLFGLSYILCFFGLRTFRLRSLVTSQIYVSCFPFTILYVSLARTMSSLHFLGLCSFPSTLSYCTSLTLLRSRTRLPLRCIRSLVYIFRVLVFDNLRTNITYFSSRLCLRFLGTLGPSGSAPAVFVSSALELISSGTRSGVGSR